MTGRPTDYKPEYARQAAKACEMGATDKDLAEFFDVCEATINNWKKDHPSFLESLKAKEVANKRVERALYERATGYSHSEDKIFNDNGSPLVVPTTKRYPPDTGACVVWLANRDPENWKKEPGSQQSTETPQPLVVNFNQVDATKKDGS